jgi:Na+/H+-dicarboxylate symporter/ABC-type amino acid transport substrate-binding protein
VAVQPPQNVAGNQNPPTRGTRLTFSGQVLVGLAAGIAVGVFLGELVAPLQIVADGFVKLLQMTVLPYVTVSIIVTLGRLDFGEARRLGKTAGAVLACLWLVGIVYSFLVPLVFPPSENASFFTSSLVEKPAAFDFVDLYIPSNPFHSLANNVVPAVVLFSAILGIALIGVERKGMLLDILQIVSTTISRATRFVVRLTPYGIFALTATAAGTLNVEQLQRIQVYLVTYAALSLLVAIWVLPALVSTLTPIPYRAVLGPTRGALVTAFVAGDLFIVLPILIDACKELLERHLGADARSAALPDVIVPASFNFPHTAKLLSLSFILFAGWFSDAVVPVTQYPRLALTGLMTLFGSMNAAIPFLLDTFRIPADTFQLFLATSVINARIGSLVAAVHTVVVALLGSAALNGAIRLDSRRLIRYAVVTTILTVVVVGGLRVTFRTLLRHDFKGEEIVYGMSNALEHESTTVVDPPRVPANPTRPVLDSIRARGVLRVGFALPRLPYVFRNARQELVGVDLELAHLLAADLNVGVEFVEWRIDNLLDAVSRGDADIGIGGNAVTPLLAARCMFSEAYLEETVAFIVKDHLRSRFETWASIQNAKDLVIGVPALPYYQRLLQSRLPDFPLKAFPRDQNPLDDRAGFDAVAYPAERGSVLTLLNPKWTVVVPQPGIIKVPLAFPLALHDQAWANLVNTWIELKRRDGTLDTLYKHWILGEAARTVQPRWSIVRNVLHWTK